MAVTSLDDKQIAAIAAKEGLDAALVRSINDAAVAHDVPPTLLLAVAKRETDFGRSRYYDTATGLGDGTHGHGMFQLDDRTPSHRTLSASVEHDPAKAADVAATMLHDELSRGRSAVDALHVYNSGKLDRPSTRGEYEGKSVAYETAVSGWAHGYDVAAGIAPPSQHVENAPPSAADQNLVNSRIADAAEKMRGMSTRDAQTHHPELENGNVACAYSVNKVLDTALGRTYGENKEYVPSVMADLRRHGTEIEAEDVRPGDIAIKLPGAGERHGHIGIVTRGGDAPLILNNSSSHGSLTNEDTPAHFSRNYVTKREDDKVVYVRIDPSSVDMAHVRATPVPERVLGPDNAPPNPTTWSERTPAHSAPQPVHHTTLLDDRHTRNGSTIHGEVRDGVRAESDAELHRKNEIVAEAVRDAKEGKTLDFHFIGNGKESAREVALQNEKLDRAIEKNLPASAGVHLVPLDEKTRSAGSAAPGVLEKAEHIAADAIAAVEKTVKQWTPEMNFSEFGKLLEKIRGGPSHEAPKSVAKGLEKPLERGSARDDH